MDVDLLRGIRIPLRDGVCLNAVLYRGRDQQAPAPVLIALTPYTCDNDHERGVYFAARGMQFAIVDVRGRGDSEGTFRPFVQEAHDAYDVVEWLARQPYCNGKVAMWGGSYGGYAQWVAATQFPPHLMTIVPAAAPFMGLDFPMRRNIFSPYLARWLTLVAGRTSQRGLFADDAFWSGHYRRWHESGRSFRDIDAALGAPSEVLQEWLSHPEPDSYWDAHNPTAEACARLQLPILTITGSYDDDQPGALEHYKRHMRHASASAHAKHYLIIGPWDHAGTRAPRRLCGGIELGESSLLDLAALHLEWYGWTLHGGPRPAFLKNQVAYYVTGAEEWRYADALESVTAQHRTYFLNSTGEARDVFASGTLISVPGEGAPDEYRFDPADAHAPEVEAEARATADSLIDQSTLLALRGRVLVYHSDPLDRDTEICGFFRFVAWISIDCPDTDIYVSVHEIDLHGGSVRLSTDALRARYREDARMPKPIRSREALRYDFDGFTFVACRIARGHRLRLVIAPVGRLVESTFTQKNYNAGGIVAEESAAEARIVTVRLFHDEARPSALYVPLGPEGMTS